MAAKTFTFRMSSEGAEQTIADLRKLAVASAEGQRALTSLTQASPQLASVQDGVQAKLRGTTQALKDASGGMGTFAGALRMGGGIGAGFAVVQAAIGGITASVGAIPKAGDAAFESLNRLNAIIGDLSRSRAVFNDLAAVSRQTGVSIGDSAATFGRFAVAAKDLGVTNAQIVELVGGIQKFGIVAGASTQETQSATQQLGQALASGKFQGDELRSVMENMPQLAQALAKELGTSIGNLRQMGTEGKLTADVVMPALLRAVQGIDAEFAKMPVSMARAQAQFDVSAKGFLAHIDEAIGLSQKLAKILEGAASLIDRVRTGAGGASAAERQALLAAQQPGIQSRIAGFDQMIADTRRSGVMDGDPALANLIRSRNAIATEMEKNRAELLKINNEVTLQIEADEAIAADNRLKADKDKSEERIKVIREELDKSIKLRREYDDQIKTINRGIELGTIDAATGTKLTAGATKDFNEALAKLEDKAKTAGGAVKDFGKDAAEALANLRKAQSDALSVEAELDPRAAAGQRLDAQIARIRGGVGVGALSEKRGQELESAAFEQLYASIDKVGKSVTETDRTFDQFFANLASKTEDAITNWKGFGNLAQSVAKDIASVLLRSFVLNPLASAGKGVFSDILGLFSGGGSPGYGTAIAGSSQPPLPFANGGIMDQWGDVPLKRYAGGGVARTPQMALFGEGSQPEAYVPLPDGRSIPVKMQGGGGGMNYRGGDIHIHVANSNASAGMIAVMSRHAAREENQRFVAEIQRGGPMAKVTGRRANR